MTNELRTVKVKPDTLKNLVLLKLTGDYKSLDELINKLITDNDLFKQHQKK